MIEDVFERMGLSETHTDLARDIASIRAVQDIFDDRSEHPDAWASAIWLDMAAKSSFFIFREAVIDRPFKVARWHDDIKYPFRHRMRNRYSDGTFGVWYGADTAR